MSVSIIQATMELMERDLPNMVLVEDDPYLGPFGRIAALDGFLLGEVGDGGGVLPDRLVESAVELDCYLRGNEKRLKRDRAVVPAVGLLRRGRVGRHEEENAQESVNKAARAPEAVRRRGGPGCSERPGRSGCCGVHLALRIRLSGEGGTCGSPTSVSSGN